MATQHTSWITLDEAITAYMNEAEISNHKYFKLWHISFDAMTQLGLDAFYQIKSVKLPVLANLTVPYPADCLMVSKVGVFNNSGEVVPLSNNNNLSTAYDLSPTRLSQTQDNTIVTTEDQQGAIWYNYWNGAYVGNLYGLPSGAPFIGSYKLDNTNQLVVLNENFNYPYIVLEYTASPSPDGEYYIPIQFKEAVVAYLRWKDKISIPAKTHMDNSNISMRRHDFFEARRLAIARIDPVKLPELYEWNLQNQRVAIKA